MRRKISARQRPGVRVSSPAMLPVRFVAHLPDLIDSREYAADPDGRKVRVRVRVTPEGVEVLGDAVRPAELEVLLAALGADCIEQMLCG